MVTSPSSPVHVSPGNYFEKILSLSILRKHDEMYRPAHKLKIKRSKKLEEPGKVYFDIQRKKESKKVTADGQTPGSFALN